jgi:hypothetical protein
MAVWALLAAGAYSVTGNKLFEKLSTVGIAILALFVLYYNRFSARARKRAVAKRRVRNDFLPGALLEAEKVALELAPNRELELADLRDI